MSRHREFEGITRNLAYKLNGRNNDHLGYWSVGQLNLIAERDVLSSVKIDESDFCFPGIPN